MTGDFDGLMANLLLALQCEEWGRGPQTSSRKHSCVVIRNLNPAPDIALSVWNCLSYSSRALKHLLFEGICSMILALADIIASVWEGL